MSNSREELAKKYLKHTLENPVYQQFPSLRRRVSRQPVCPKCERPALRHTQPDPSKPPMVACNYCGYFGPHTITVEEYMEEHLVGPLGRGYRDRHYPSGRR